MMTKDEALDLALDALEVAVGDDAHDYQKYLDAITAIKQARSAQQEPVAFKVINGELCYKSEEDDQSFGMWCPVTPQTDLPFVDGTKFYTTPPAQPAPEQRYLGVKPCWYESKEEKMCPKCGQVHSGAIFSAAQPAPVQVSPLEFVTMVMEKEHLVGKPLFWAEWPNKENA